MKIYELRPIGNLDPKDDPWNPWYDKCFGFVIVANNEQEARLLAHKNACDENTNNKTPWLHKKYSTCIEVESIGLPRVVIKDVDHA